MSQTVQVDSLSPKAQVSSIIISKDMRDLQSLYVIYYKDFQESKAPFMKVFKQVTKGAFFEYTNSDLYMQELYEYS